MRDVPLVESQLGLVLVVLSFELGPGLVSQAELPMASGLGARAPSHYLVGPGAL